MFVSKRKGDVRKSVALVVGHACFPFALPIWIPFLSVALVVGVSWRLQRNIRLGHAVLVFSLRCRCLFFQVIVLSSRLGLSPIVVSGESELRLGMEKRKNLKLAFLIDTGFIETGACSFLPCVCTSPP